MDWSTSKKARVNSTANTKVATANVKSELIKQTYILANTTGFPDSLPGNHICYRFLLTVKVQFQIFFGPVLATNIYFQAENTQK